MVRLTISWVFSLYTSISLRHRVGNQIFRTMATKKVKESPTESGSPAVKKRKVITKAATVGNEQSEGVTNGDEDELTRAKTSPSKRQQALDSEPHIRDELVSNPLMDGKSYIKIITWNVNGLSALINGKKHVLDGLIEKHQPDILCLQETKIQETLVEEYRNLLPHYWSFWNCSTVKKGYSGTVDIHCSSC